MIEHIVFSVTAFVTVLNLMVILSILTRSKKMTLAFNDSLFDLAAAWWFYPSAIYQIYFWSAFMFAGVS